MPQARLVLATAFLAVAALGCKPVEQPVTPAGKSAAGVIVDGAEVGVVDHPAQMFPRDTQMIGWVSGAARAAEVFERDRLAEKFPEVFAEMKREIVDELGYDVLDPATYAGVGIDPNGRLGGAVISFTDDAGAFFFTLSDVGKFKQAVRSVAGRKSVELVETQYGPATLLADPRGQSEVAVVIRDSIAIVVIQERDQDAPIRYADSIAKIDPRQSLAASAEYRKALGGLRDSDAMGFANIGLIAGQELARQVRTEDGGNEWLARELEAAKERGATAEEIADLQRQADQDAQWREESAARDAVGRRIVETLTRGVEGLGFAIAVKRTGPVLDGQLVLREDAFLRRLVKVSADGLTLPRALNGEPVMLFGGNVDIDAAMEVVDMFAQAEGENLHDAGKELAEKALGINPFTELVPLLTGEGTFAVTLEAPIDFAHLDELPKQIGVTMHAAISDPKRVEALLAKIDSSDTESGKLVRKQDGEYVFDVPEFRTMRAVVAGSNLLVTTDKGLAGRLATHAEGSMRKDADPPGPFYVMTLPNVGGAWVTDLRYIAGFFLGTRGFSTFDDGPIALDRDGDVDWNDVEASRMSRTAKQKKEALVAAKDKLRKENAAVQAQEGEHMMGAFKSFGSTAFVIQPNDRGFSVAGGQFVGAATLGGVVESMLTLSLNNGPEIKRDKLEAAFTAVAKAETEYREARLSDYARANKGGRGKKKTGAAKPEGKAAAPKRADTKSDSKAKPK